MEMIWDHSVTQENCGSKLPMYSYTISAANSHSTVPALQNYTQDRSVTQENCVPQCKKSKKLAKNEESVFQ